MKVKLLNVLFYSESINSFMQVLSKVALSFGSSYQRFLRRLNMIAFKRCFLSSFAAGMNVFAADPTYDITVNAKEASDSEFEAYQIFKGKELLRHDRRRCCQHDK